MLGHLLAEAPRDQVLRYLEAYEAIRLPVGNGVLTGSYESGMMYEFNSEYSDKYETLGLPLRLSGPGLTGCHSTRSSRRRCDWHANRSTAAECNCFI